MPQVFGRGPCRFCQMRVSSCGYGEWNHLRKHYREVYGKEPSPHLGVRDLSVALIGWRNKAILDKDAAGGVY